MPRPGQPAASTLRNRNRITNKSRLKIVRGNLDVEPIIPDEDEEKNRLLQSVAGVDQEDANEHHLQVVLSQAAVQVGRPGRTGDNESDATAFIPVPDHAGVAENYEKLYPSRRWKDPVSYVQSTYSVEELCTGALADGCTYYMDERGKEWLDRNNEEARGEGTSAQGCVSPGSRASARSAKAKGKEPEEQPTVISEDEFELVMGLYEKITHDKTEFLHHGLENGMSFPEFSEYQESFSSPLPPATFAAYKAPPWLPESARLLGLARIIYPYWKERRLERAGHRIIPVLNYDESDTLNESFVCFRRRETKAIRKTRTAQVTSSDKLAQLQAEFQYPIQLAQSLLSREQVKRDFMRQSQMVWDCRMRLVDLRVKHPDLVDKADDEMLVDKERLEKKPDVSRVRLSAKHDTSAQAHALRVETRGPTPRELSALYQSKIDATVVKQKEIDQHWEDYIDTGYVSPLVAHSSRLFKYINPSTTKSTSGIAPNTSRSVQRRPLRLRYGRGGRAFIDRRLSSSDHVPKRRRRIVESDDEDDAMDIDEGDAADEEADLRLAERWRFDVDDGPHYGLRGSDEQDRIMVDDYDTSYLSHSVSLLNEVDVANLLNDPTITRITQDGKKEGYVPFRLGMLPPTMRATPSPAKGISSPGAQAAPKQTPAQPQSQQLPVQTSQVATQSPAQLTTATNGVTARPPAQVSPPARSQTVMPSPQVTQNGRPAMTMPHIDMTKLGFGHTAGQGLPKAEMIAHSQPSPSEPVGEQAVIGQKTTNSEASAPNQQHMNGYVVTNGNASYPIAHFLPPGLNTQQMQNLKLAFNATNMNMVAAGGNGGFNAAMYMQMAVPQGATNGVDGVNRVSDTGTAVGGIRLPVGRTHSSSGTSTTNAGSPPRPGPFTSNDVASTTSPRVTLTARPPPSTSGNGASRGGVNWGSAGASGQMQQMQQAANLVSAVATGAVGGAGMPLLQPQQQQQAVGSSQGVY